MDKSHTKVRLEWPLPPQKWMVWTILKYWRVLYLRWTQSLRGRGPSLLDNLLKLLECRLPDFRRSWSNPLKKVYCQLWSCQAPPCLSECLCTRCSCLSVCIYPCCFYLNTIGCSSRKRLKHHSIKLCLYLVFSWLGWVHDKWSIPLCKGTRDAL